MDPFFFAYATVLLGVTLAALFPGAGFAMVLRNATSISRKAGIFTALGLSTGVAFHASLVLFGVAYFVLGNMYIRELVRLVGASYLAYSGISSLVRTQKTLATPSGVNIQMSDTPLQSFSQGLLTNIFNPKTLIFNLAIFAPFINSPVSIDKKILFIATFFTVEFTWFTIVSTLLTHPQIQKAYESKVIYLVRFSGALLLFFGIVLVFKDFSI